MSRLPFLPARNSRHRIAALSLYRALLRSADKIALPTDVRGADSKHAIGRMIKKQFLKNRQLTSFRLVYASIAAGYKFLSLFAKAHNSSSPEYAQLLAYLRARPARGSACRPRQVLGKPEEPAREPFLKNVSGSDEPRYVATMGPGTLKGRIPHLCATADGQPFIRLRNPQPRALSKMVGRKGEIFRTKMAKMMAATEELAQDAALEDDWDDLVAEQRSREESTAKDAQAPVRPEYPSTFTWTAQLTRLWWEWQIEKTWRDWMARGEALHRFVQAEQKHLDELQSNKDLIASPPPSASSSSFSSLSSPSSPSSPSPPSSTTRTSRNRKTPSHERDAYVPNVGANPTPPFPLIASIKLYEQRGGKNLYHDTGNGADPFLGPHWNALVHMEKARLLKWTARGRSASKRNGYSSSTC